MTVVASGYAPQINDLYQTEPWATRALLRVRPLAGLVVWEPCAGNHMIADVLRLAGAHVLTSDIAVYERAHDCIYDFFSDAPSPFPHVHAIVTNPPYGKQNRLAVGFARRALARCAGVVALLLTAKFDFGSTRYDLFRDNPRFAGKIALTNRVQWFPGDHGGTENHAWYIWGAGRREAFAAPILGRPRRLNVTPPPQILASLQTRACLQPFQQSK